MYKKTLTYMDWNDVERTEDFHFNLSKAELAEMNLGTEGGLKQRIEAIVAAKDVPEIAAIFKELILKSYGEKSPDGKRFMKVKDDGTPLSRAFSETAAYSELYMLLASNEQEATAFFNGIVPKMN